jgi:mannose-1-phosphate guanylyltransferase
MPKPLVPFANRPMMEHQVQALAEVRAPFLALLLLPLALRTGAQSRWWYVIQAGVTDIVLAVSYRPETMMAALRSYEEQVRRLFLLCVCVYEY